MDLAGLGHNTYTPEALALVVPSTFTPKSSSGRFTTPCAPSPSPDAIQPAPNPSEAARPERDILLARKEPVTCIK